MPARPQNVMVFEIFAGRAAAELRRLRAEREKVEAERRVRSLTDETEYLRAELRELGAHDTFTFAFDGPPSAFVAALRRFYGPTMNAFEAAERSGRAGELLGERETLFAEHNRSGRPDVTIIPAGYLRVTVAL